MKHSFYYLLLLVMTGLGSCHQTKDVTCTNGTLVFTGAGFTNADYSNAIIVKYEPDNHFDNPVDTGKITYYFFQRGTVISDSAGIYVQFKNDGGPAIAIPASYDYIIMFPSAGINDTINNVKFLGRTSETFAYSGVYNDRPLVCFNPIISYTCNGGSYTASAPSEQVVILTK